MDFQKWVLFLQGAIVVNIEKLFNGHQEIRKTTLSLTKAASRVTGV